MRSIAIAALPLTLICAPIQAASPNAPTAPTQVADPNARTPPDRAPSLMTSREIAAFNQGLENSHPYFIKCRRLEETGSLVKKARVCRTNEQWRVSSSNGNQNARETVEAMSKAGVNSSN